MPAPTPMAPNKLAAIVAYHLMDPQRARHYADAARKLAAQRSITEFEQTGRLPS